MSVENSFYLVDWKILKGKYEHSQSTDFIGEALESDEPWLEHFQIDEEYAHLWESWQVMITFSDWYRDLRKNFKGKDQALYDFFTDVGCVADEEERFAPIQDLTQQEDEWVFSAISPEKAANLLKRFNSIDISGFKQAVESGVTEKIRDYISSFADFTRYFNGFGKVVKAANGKKRGVLVLAS